jgi:hypothetical protein
MRYLRIRWAGGGQGRSSNAYKEGGGSN